MPQVWEAPTSKLWEPFTINNHWFLFVLFVCLFSVLRIEYMLATPPAWRNIYESDHCSCKTVSGKYYE